MDQAGMNPHDQENPFKQKSFYLETKDMLPTMLRSDEKMRERQETSSFRLAVALRVVRRCEMLHDLDQGENCLPQFARKLPITI